MLPFVIELKHSPEHKHINLLVSEEMLSSIPSKSCRYCVREWVGKWSVMLGEGVKDAFYPQMLSPSSQRSPNIPDHVFSPLLCPPPSPALVAFIH